MRIGNLPGIRRLPLYLDILYRLRQAGDVTTSANILAHESGYVASVVRKDLEMTETSGTTGIGYSVAELIAGIESFLGWDNPHDAFLVGAGMLGTAILGCREFRSQGLNIVAAFDTDPGKAGTWIHGIEVLPLDKLSSLARRLHIGIGVLTVPSDSAQLVADMLVEAGIARIWSFATLILEVPPHVTVQRENLAAGLAELLVRSSVRSG